MTDPFLDRPEESASADVTLVAHGVTITARVEVSDVYTVVVRPSGNRAQWDAAEIKPGDPVELYWVGGTEERTLGGTVAKVEPGDDARWHLAVEGQAERSQRRKAVRARVSVPVIIPWADSQMVGTTVDLSEGGMRALVDGWGVPPLPATRSQVSLEIDDALLHLHGEIVWTTIRGAQWLLAMKFLDVSEKDGDLVRRRVFQALRDERAARPD
jgi:PilZ domain